MKSRGTIQKTLDIGLFLQFPKTRYATIALSAGGTAGSVESKMEMKMGWIMLPKPGAKDGPCKGNCKHLDCKATKQEAECLCTHCQKPIGFETKFYIDRPESGISVVGQRIYSHFLCAIKAADERRKKLPPLDLGHLGAM
jgi:hypothetical protein